MIRSLTLPFIFIVQSFSVAAQDAIPERPSPLALTACRYKDSYLKIVYSQPHKKGREVFGSLVPYGQVWRTGANEATEITLTKDVFINGKSLTAGTYSLFTIPEKDKWTLIFNKDLGMWGAYNYNPAVDVLRVESPVLLLDNNAVFEPFTIRVDHRNNKADIVLLWDNVKVSFAVDFIEPKP